MATQFLENDVDAGICLLLTITDGLKNAKAVDIAVSYLQMSGWFMLQRAFKELDLKRVRIITTDQLCITQPAVLKEAISLGIQIKCYRGSRTFHPKVYIIHGTTKSKNHVILGSANISASGLESGIEAGFRLSDVSSFRRLNEWFEGLIRDSAVQSIDQHFVETYEKRWKRAARSRVQRHHRAEASKRAPSLPTVEDAEVLDDILSTVSRQFGTLGFDQAGNNIRNLNHMLKVLKQFPRIGAKQKSELHLLGLFHNKSLSQLGKNMLRCRTVVGAAKLWCAWVKATPDSTLNALNGRLVSFKHAATRFWQLNPSVRSYFLKEINNKAELQTLKAIELCCNGSDIVKSLSLSDFKSLAPLMLIGNRASEFIKRAVDDYLDNKGARSWEYDDRRVILNAWQKS